VRAATGCGKPQSAQQAKTTLKGVGMKKIHIRSTGKRFCRCGIQFTQAEQTFMPGDLTEEQIDILEREPRLSIRYETLPEIPASETLPEIHAAEALPQGAAEPKEPKKVRLDKDLKK
jgi:Mu-like prophage FluMu N-terminal domain